MNKKGRFELPYILAISDGTTTIDLTKPPFALISWKPTTSPYKGGGTFSESPLSNGRKLIDAKRENIRDTIAIALSTLSQDQNIADERTLRGLCQKALDYWTTGWQSTPVYLIAQSSRETNKRYAHLYIASIPQDSYLYGQPFIQPDGSALQVDLVIETEHTEWLSNPPGTGECLPLKLVTNLDDSTYLERILEYNPIGVWKLNETSAVPVVNYSVLGSALDGSYVGGASIFYDDTDFTNGDSTNFISLGGNYYINLFTSDLADNFDIASGSVVIWQYDTGLIWTSGSIHGFFAFITDSGQYIKVYKGATDYELVCEVFTTNPTTPDFLTIDLTDVPNLDKWFAVVVTWENVDYPSQSMNVNMYFRGNNSTGGIVRGRLAGTLDEFVLGNTSNAGTDSLSGNLAYAQYYDEPLSLINTAKLSVPPLPVSTEESCIQNVHFANKHTYAPLTHIFAFDASLASFSTNKLLASLPYNLYPASPAVGDILYIGIDATTANPFPSGRFANLVFDVAIGQGITSIDEYWNGAAWTTLTESADNTEGFEVNSVHAVVWVHPSNQVGTLTVNGVSGWWWRRRITAVSSPVSPQQQNRQPYTVTWPYIEMSEENVGGDIAALVRYLISNVSTSNFVTPTYDILHTNRVMAGLRSLSRGEVFTAYLNISDQQQTPGTLITLGSNTTWTTNVEAATGRCALYSTMTIEAMQTEVTVALNGSVSAEYLGKFKMFLRATPVHSGFSAYCQIKVSISPNVVIFTTEKVDFGLSVAEQTLFDFGRIVIGQDMLLAEDVSTQFTFEIQIQNTANSAFDVNLFELILLPIDEWSIDTASIGENITDNEGGILAGEYISLDIDSIYNPKYSPRALIRSQLYGDSVKDRYKVRSPGEAIVQANADQRLWFISTAYAFDAFGTEFSKPFVVNTARAEKNERYRSARGNS
jgi:hypothetical protein